MSAEGEPLHEIVQELPSDIRAKYATWLVLAKRGRGKKRALRQDWAGALREYREQYTSLELQRQALAWRGGRSRNQRVDG